MEHTGRGLDTAYLLPEVDSYTPLHSPSPSSTLLNETSPADQHQSTQNVQIKIKQPNEVGGLIRRDSIEEIDKDNRTTPSYLGHFDLEEDQIRRMPSRDGDDEGDAENGELIHTDTEEESRPNTSSPPQTANQRPNSNRKSASLRSSTALSTPHSISERPLHHEVQLLYKGRKYNWQAKVNLHVHVIRHDYADSIEVIAFNTSNFTEAEHVYVPASVVFQRVDEPSNHEKTELLMHEYNKLHVHCPSYGYIFEGLLNYRAAMHLVDRLTVSLKPSFSIDIKEAKRGVALLAGTATGVGPATSSVPSTKVKDSGPSINEATVSLTHRKPDIVIPCYVRRYGKSSTLVGDVIGTSLTKDEEILQKLIINLNSPSLANQAHRIISRFSMINKNKKRVIALGGLKGFAKFKNDNDLLQESLSFLHISDFMILQCVCKRWHTVLGYALKANSSLWISSRDYYLNEEFVRRKLKSRYAMVSRRQRDRELDYDGNPVTSPRGGSSLPSHPHAADTFFYGSMSRYFRPRDVFVSSDTVLRAIRSTTKTITELALHYVVVDADLLMILQTLGGKLKRLSLGIIKVNDVFKKFSLIQEVNPTTDETPEILSPPSPTVIPTTPRGTTPSTPRRGARPSNAGKSVNVQHRKMTISGAPTVITTSPVLTRLGSPSTDSVSSAVKPSSPSSSVRWYPGYQQKVQQYLQQQQMMIDSSALRFLQSGDVEQILRACGMDLTHLELSLTVGDLDPRLFHFTPKLTSFTIFNSHLAPRIQSVHNDLEGNVSFKDFVDTFSNIPMSDLLAYISDSSKESFLLTDKRGRIVTANDAWEKMFGYLRKDIVGRTVDFLGGYMTNMEAYEEVIEGLKTQIKPVESTVFLHQQDGTPFLVQVILIPNCSKFRGLALTVDCLTQDFIGQLALEQEETLSKGLPGVSLRDFKVPSKVKLDWRITNKEVSYHLLRFGLICEPFLPYERHVVSAQGSTENHVIGNNNNHAPATTLRI